MASAKPAGSGMPIRLKLSLLLAAISFVLYANTFKNGFAVDDSVMVASNKYVTQGFSAIPTLLLTPHQRGFWEVSDDEYRPLSLVVFAATVQIFSVNPMPLHILNVLLFVGCVVLLFRFVHQLVGAQKLDIAFVASLLFALHPIHTEVVANIKSMDEVLCFLFAFLSLNVFLKYNETGKTAQLVSGGLFFFLSLLSKETSVTFLGIVPLIFFYYKNEHRQRGVRITVATVLAVGLFLGIRYAVLSYYHANVATPVNVLSNALTKPGLPAESKLATAIMILGYYVRLLFIPYPLNSDYSYNTIPFTHFTDPIVLLSIAFYAGIMIWSVRLFIRDRKSLFAFGAFWFLLTLALFSNIFVTIKATMGERFMFFPSVGFCLTLALLIDRLKGQAIGMKILRRPLVAALLAVICIPYSVITLARNEDWKDNYTLYGADVKKAPDNARLNYMFGYNLFTSSGQVSRPEEKKQLLIEAAFHMRKATAILPNYYFALADLGAAYYDLGRPDSARIFDSAAIKAQPTAALPRNNLSGVYLQTGQYELDIELCKATIEQIKDDGNAYADIGLSYIHLGQYDIAFKYLYEGIANAPDFYGCYDVLGFLFHRVGKEDSSQKYKALAERLKGR